MEDMQAFDPGFDKAILLTISTETTLIRLSGRRTCSQCGEVFNVVTMPPKKAGICDNCGGAVVQREDDKEEAILTRLSIYRTETQEVLDYLREKNILVEIDGEPSPEIVFENVKKSLNI
jgi:adenylate kinase